MDLKALVRKDVKAYAKEIVASMLCGRCCPEVEDVEDITDDAVEQQMIIDEIETILNRLRKILEPKK